MRKRFLKIIWQILSKNIGLHLKNISKNIRCARSKMIKMKLNRNESDSLFSSPLFLDFFLGLLLFFGGAGFFFELFQSIHGDLGGSGDAGSKLVGSSGESNFASLAFPDST